MNSRWKAFLDSQSAGSDQDPATRSDGDTDLRCILADLSHLGLIRVGGEDARDFLQGQFTNDIREVSDSHYQLSSYCTPKGRMLANFLLFERAGDFYLQMPRETLPAVLKRLPMFVLMSKVSIEDHSDELVRIGLAGACAESLLGKRFDSLPGSTGQTHQEQGITLLRLAGAEPRFELISGPEEIIELWRQLSATALPVDPDHWALLDIRAGIPTVYGATIEAFVPQMTNMHSIDGVSFTKGCYTGQEVVARMKYLGKLKRRMYLARVSSDSPPQVGEELFSTGSQSGQGAGKIVDARPSPDGGYELLAVVEISRAEANDLHLGGIEGPQLEFLDLPYSLEEA